MKIAESLTWYAVRYCEKIRLDRKVFRQRTVVTRRSACACGFPCETEAPIEVWINFSNRFAELTGLEIASILITDPLSCAVCHRGLGMGLGRELLIEPAFFPYRAIAHATAGSVFWP